jgi:hypothetical protein
MMRRPHLWLIAASVATFGITALDSGLAHGQGNRGLPFQNIYSRPAVSPYTLLGTQGSGGGINSQNGATSPLVYQQIIQPQIQQQQQQVQQVQQTRQLSKLQGQVQQIQRDTSARQVNESLRATGHASTYQNLSHFYPAAR